MGASNSRNIPVQDEKTADTLVNEFEELTTSKEEASSGIFSDGDDDDDDNDDDDNDDSDDDDDILLEVLEIEEVQENEYVRVNVRGDGLCMWWSILTYLVMVKKTDFKDLVHFRNHLVKVREILDNDTINRILDIGSRSLSQEHIRNIDETNNFINEGTKPESFTPDAWREYFSILKLKICIVPCPNEMPNTLESLREYFDNHDQMVFGDGDIIVYIVKDGNHYNALVPRSSFNVKAKTLGELKSIDNLLNEMFDEVDEEDIESFFPLLSNLHKDVLLEIESNRTTL